MKRSSAIIAMILLTIIIYGCGPVTAIPATQEPVATAQPIQAEPAYHPLTTQTGIAELDAVLEAVASRDAQTLRSFLELTDTKCTTSEGLGGPPKCREGEEEGTPVRVLPFLGPEGHFLREEELEDWPGIDARGLYAVYEVSPEAFADENYPAGEHALLLAGTETSPMISLRVRDGKIVRIDNFFQEVSLAAVQEILQREASTVLLAPPAP